MSLKEKLKKIKESCARKEFVLLKDEKTGVLNGLLLLGAAVATLLSMESHPANAAACVSNVVNTNSAGGLPPTPTTAGNAGTICSDTVDQKVTDTGENARDSGLDISAWQDHTWHDHCWWDHCWWDHSWDNFSDGS